MKSFKIGDRVKWIADAEYGRNPSMETGTVTYMWSVKKATETIHVEWDNGSVHAYSPRNLIRVLNGIDRVLEELK